jgi:hypothetical protein
MKSLFFLFSTDPLTCLNPDPIRIRIAAFNSFAIFRTTSIVQRQQKEHLQEEMHEQMSGYKRLRRDHQVKYHTLRVVNRIKTKL